MSQFGVAIGGLSMESNKMLSIEHLSIIGSGSSYNASLYGNVFIFSFIETIFS